MARCRPETTSSRTRTAREWRSTSNPRPPPPRRDEEIRGQTRNKYSVTLTNSAKPFCPKPGHRAQFINVTEYLLKLILSKRINGGGHESNALIDHRSFPVGRGCCRSA